MNWRIIVSIGAVAVLLGTGALGATASGRPDAGKHPQLDPERSTAPAWSRCVSPICGGWAVFDGAVRGAVLGRLIDEDTVRVQAAFEWDLDYDGVKIVGSDIRCGETHAAANKVFASLWDLGHPDALFGTAKTTRLKDLDELRSIRLFRREGDRRQLACAKTRLFVRLDGSAVGDPAAEGAFASTTRPFADGLVLTALAKEEPKARLTLALGGLTPSRTHTVFGSEAPCNEQHEPSDLEFSRTFVTADDGRRFSTATIETADPYGLRSIRLVRGTGTDGPFVDCAKGFFIEIGGVDVWIP